MSRYIIHSMSKERGRDRNASRMVYFCATGTWLQNLSLKYNSILIRYAFLTIVLTFSMITNPGTCVFLNDVVNCKEYIVLVVDDYISMEILRSKNLFQCHFGQHKSCMDWHGTEPGSLR